MAAIDEFQTYQELAHIQEIPDWVKPLIKATVAKFFWTWYHQHENDKIVSIGWWIIKKTVRVRDIHGVFVLLFGEETQSEG
jgi:hypothetical protein